MIWKFIIRQFHKIFGPIVHHWLAVGFFLLSNGAKDKQPAPVPTSDWLFSIQLAEHKGLTHRNHDLFRLGNCIYDYEKRSIFII